MTKLKIVFLFLLLGASVEFVMRGPYRFLVPPSRLNDITYIYVPARAMIQGSDPYDPASFERVCQCNIPATDVRAHSAYPWTIYVLMAPLAFLTWSHALYVWAAVQVILVLLMIWALVSFEQLTGVWASAFIVFVLTLAPLHTGLASGNVSIASIALCAIAVWVASTGAGYGAGMLLGVATCLKPQIGICFLLYYALRRDWRVTFWCAGTGAAIGLAGMVWLTCSFGTVWMHHFLNNAAGFAAKNRFNDFTFNQPMRFTLINLQVLFYSIFGNASLANWLALLLGAIMLAVWGQLVWRSTWHPILLELSTICVASLLPVYHRSYDAALLIIAICWSVSRLQRGGRRERGAVVALLLMVPFLAPGGALLQGLVEQNHIPPGWVGSWWWQTIVMPHEIWLLLMLACWLMYQFTIESDCEPVPRPAS